MPPRTGLRSRSLRVLHAEPYVCPSCASQRTTRTRTNDTGRNTARSFATRHINPLQAHDTRPRQAKHTGSGVPHRFASNDNGLASRTAVNAPSTVPIAFRELHQQLLLLQDKASSYVDLARLQLALRSLESKDPIIRIAFLGLGAKGTRAARKLARALLADELGDEAEWERGLLHEDEGKGILLKYGEADDGAGVLGGSPVVKEMRIPSPRLKRWNAEILVSGLNASGYVSSDAAEGAKELEESILVPPVTIPGAGSRVGFVRYPVHQALILAEGVSGAVEFGKLPTSLVDGRLINAALSLPLRGLGEMQEAGATDIELAEQALALFRSSNANGAIYSQQWQASRVQSVSNWISHPSDTTEPRMKPALADMLESILSRAHRVVSSAEVSAETASAALAVPKPKRLSIQAAISSWSEEAHRDLQMNLASALLSPTWRRTTWWRLFWRIDEVSISASDVLRRGWLVEAEQNLAFLSGRIVEAGLATVEELKRESASDPAAETGLLDKAMKNEIGEYKAVQSGELPSGKVETVAELMQLPPMLARVEEQSGLNAMFDPPWPQTIHLSRQQMLHRLVPSMHRKAQALMLASLSTIGGSGALAGWLWVASGGVALYEAGAIAALGLVWALRRLQKKWTNDREAFTESAREDARRVLADLESRLKRTVNDSGRVIVRTEDKAEWAAARAAIEACHNELVKVAGENDVGSHD
ncbi:hypothetical protein CLAFUW4_07056 [Fulvia fulva]|uniref:Mmc1 C-terminal domain-containing protein n=1 Tax=Passalora fulva TaxID=5499 RepID=A0A9Q8P9S1_PASFU|nr:uncharacterized protein CLAFUR5_07193 [Fulvia fulva]KAK4622210.1 hypothetical protein CLAFUR4_07065 [Fulvia fulva]KAK4622995.1 hypothetical protein CLAFUR0_07063 [Fulvia fulva]UJO18463.1 hypothetical protein CLAFUR5_07193 [Fulvia fulva]WPV15913.1 hypothetical protein CLAFUW4_07056 [Fulvia fulva]WPV31385.1 hypothetical protein CLAFUW7_07056 [Fulvia fulva]